MNGDSEYENENGDGINSKTITASIVIHALIIALFASIGFAGGCFTNTEEKLIPIDLTVVVDDSEPPPEEPPPVTKPTPPPPPVKPIENAVEIVKTPPVKKIEPPKPDPKPPKPDEKPKPVRPKFVKGQRITRNTPPKPVTTRPTAKPVDKKLSEEEIRKALNSGARPGTVNNLSANETQRCVSLIKRAYSEEWVQPAWRDGLKNAVVEIQLDSAGVIKSFRLISSSRSAEVDDSIRAAGRRVHSIPGLSQDFLKRNGTIRFELELRHN